jgi:hypothetical protein
MLTHKWYNDNPQNMLIPPWITPTMTSCVRTQPLKGNTSPIYANLYNPSTPRLLTDRTIYLDPFSKEYCKPCTRGFPRLCLTTQDQSNNIHQFGSNLREADDLKNFNYKPLKSCCQ